MDTAVDRDIAARTDLEARVKRITSEADKSGEPVTPEDLELIRTAQDDIAKIDQRLEVLTRDVGMADEARERIARVSRGVAAPATRYRSSGEVLFDLLHQDDEQSQRRLSGAMTRAADHMGTLAADTETDAGDLAGLVVDPVVGPVIRPYFAGMPFLSAIGMRPMPGAYKFERPYVSDPNSSDGVGVQATQKSEVASQFFTVDSDTLKAVTYAGYLNVSQQLLSFQPGSLSVIVDQMRWRQSQAVEAGAIAELALSTGVIDLPAASTPDAIYASFFDASVSVFNTTGSPATWVAMGPLGWARLGKMTDSADRPLLPVGTGSNTMGSASADTFDMAAPAGLRPVVTPAIADDSFWVGNGLSIEAYRYDFPVLEAIEPSVLGKQIAIGMAAVFHRPTPTADSAVHIYDATP